MKKFAPTSLKTAFTLSTAMFLTLGLYASPTVAQVASEPIVDDEGAFHIDRNAFDIFSGTLENDSNIPLPDGLIHNPQEGHAQSVIEGQLAPNTIDIQADTEYLEQELRSYLSDYLQQDPTSELSPEDFGLQSGTLQLRTRFDIHHSAGNHEYGEGIEVNVYGPDGILRETQRVFVSGDGVSHDAAGNPLPATASLEVIYGAQDRVELRVLNLRPDEDGEVTEHESAVYANVTGDLAVEDLQNGGDLDFNDGDYIESFSGAGETQLLGQQNIAVADVTVTTEVVEAPLPPLERQAVTLVEDLSVVPHQFIEVEESRNYGDIEVLATDANLLPHAIGLRTAEDEQVIYNQYAATSQVRLGTDGAIATGQFAPLNENPTAAPTLLIGTVRLNPFADENEAGLTASVGIAQYLSSTHQDAIDMYGNRIENPNPDGPRLLQPTGLVNDTRIVGYVPPIPDQVMPGEAVPSIDGIFQLPADQAVIIAPPDPNQVGPGAAAYDNNVGGFIIEWTDGTAEFVPQWARGGFATTPTTLPAGQANRVIYALVPQQAGQNLSLGQRYPLQSVAEGEGGHYVIAQGGFRVISALHHPQNFVLETAAVYAVEDTLPGRNAVTANFNGIQGIYRERMGGEWVETIDLTDPASADARVGNLLATEDLVIPGAPGQVGYYATHLAGGLYVRGSLTLGLGNQEDLITTTTSTYESQVATLTRTTTTDTFHTPMTQVDSFTTTTTAITFRDLQQQGDATFDIGTDGAIANVNLNLEPAQISERLVTEQDNEFAGTEIVLGSEFLADSTVDIESSVTHNDPILIDRQVDTDTDSYPNLSPLLGEIAFGGILNFGNTPWTPAANTLRTELFARATAIGESHDQDDVGLRAELVFYPFGEERRPAYGYDTDGNLVPIYQTEPVLDSNSEVAVEQVENVHGEVIEVPIYRFVHDDNGERILETVGTGRTSGPGIFVNIEELLTDDDGPTVAGGLQLTF
jgi:hypothetical protein